ncbi:MAG: tol-pal system protein YbgF [Rhodospirillales bacterium]|nr:tol-pal system protein YbgF [Rhodospirillales bacterium]
MMRSIIRSTSNHGIRPARLLGLALASALFLAAVPANSQQTDLKPLLDRLQRLERDIQTMNIQMSRGGMAPPPLSGSLASSPDMSMGGAADQPGIARLEVRLTALESEVRAVTGRVEETGHQIDQINQRLEKLIGDMDFRLSQLERGGPEMRGQAPGTQPRPATEGPQAGTSAVTPPPPGQMARSDSAAPGLAPPPGVLGTLPRQDAERAGQSAAAPPAGGASQAPAQSAAARVGALPAGSPKEQYDHAFGLLRQARYDEAESALRAFLDAHPKDPLAGNANYWLGESFYVRADYVRAAEVFLEGYQREPKGTKAADTLLKLGMSLSNLDKKREACAAFDKLTKEFPSAPSTIQQVVSRERQKNACR